MLGTHSKILSDSDSLKLPLHQPSRPSAVSAGPEYAFFRARSAEEKLTAMLIILSILALILTF